MIKLMIIAFLAVPNTFIASICGETAFGPDENKNPELKILVQYIDSSLVKGDSHQVQALIDDTIRIFNKLCIGGDGWSSKSEKRHILEDYEGDENYRLHIWERDYDPLGSIEGMLTALHIKRAQAFLGGLFAELEKINRPEFQNKLRSQIETILKDFHFSSIEALLAEP